MNEKKQIIGTLKKIDTTSKVDDNGREIHTITTKLELIEKEGLENVQDITKSLNKPIRVDFEQVQLQLID